MVAGLLKKHQALTIEQGYLFPVTFTLYTDSTLTTPVDLTGYSAEFKVRSPTVEAGTPVIDIDTANNPTKISIPTPANGAVVITVPATDTDDIEVFPEGWFELGVTPASGAANAIKVIEGYAKCTRWTNRTP